MYICTSKDPHTEREREREMEGDEQKKNVVKFVKCNFKKKRID